MKFVDKNQNEISAGDHIIPDEGYEVKIVKEAKIDDYENDILVGEQIENPGTFAILTQDNLSSQWTKRDN